MRKGSTVGLKVHRHHIQSIRDQRRGRGRILSSSEALEIDTKTVFDKNFTTTHYKCFRWFQYKLLYNSKLYNNLYWNPLTASVLFQRDLVHSPICVFCEGDEETLLRMSWGCPKIQGYWSDAQLWLHTNFTHCTDVLLSFFSLSSLRKVSRRPKHFNSMWCYCCFYLLCLIFLKELVTLSNKVNMVTHRIMDLCILIDKYNISSSKLHGTIPHINGCIR